MDIGSKDFSGWLIKLVVFVGALILFGTDYINDSIDGYNLAIDYVDWLAIFWNGG